MLPLVVPPKTVCLLRLSAIGDTCHVLPLLRSLQRAWPETRFTWVIGKLEARLMRLLPQVEFITVDKRAGFAGYRAVLRELRGRQFDVLLDLQLALRASAIALMIRAPIKLGFDRARARELQWLVTNAKIAARSHQHVLDSFLSFADALGVTEHLLHWDLPLPAEALDYAAALAPPDSPILVISACSSHRFRNWASDRYAAVARHAVQHHGLRVILAGGPSELERETGAQIEAAAGVPLLNTIGKDTLPQLLALLARSTVLLAPDSGPAHMATMVGTPVIGLYAATNPARSGPYLSLEHCVDAYARAARTFRHCEPDALPWTTKIEHPGVMDLITVDEVTAKLDALLAGHNVRMQDILVPISPGELLDKITILRIKSQRMTDAAKLRNVRTELEQLEKTWRDSGSALPEVVGDEAALQRVNAALWDIEDQIRDKEAAQNFDAGFIELARAVYVTNDERAAIKKRVNTLLGSRIVEEKSYKPYRP